jgi:hypothetical protein
MHLSSSEAGLLWYLLGLARRQSGELDVARECLGEAVGRFESSGRTEWAVRARLALVPICIQSGQEVAAASLLRDAQTALAAMGDAVGQGRAHLIASDLHNAAGRHNDAARAARHGWQVGRRMRLDWLVAAAHRRLAALSSGGRRLCHLLCGARAAERILGGIPVDLRSGYFAETRALFEGAVAALCDEGEVDRAWEMVQRAKARGMAEIVAGVSPLHLAARSPTDEPLVAEINRLLDAHRRAAYRSEFHPDAETAVAPDPANSIQELIWQLQVHNAAYAEDASLLGATWKPARPALDRRTALIEWFSIGDEIVALLLTADGLHVIREVGSVAEIRTRLGLLALGMRAYAAGRSEGGRAEGAARRALESLGDLLVHPLWNAIGGYDRLIVAPHGVLHGVPFHAVLVSGEPLWSSHDVSYVPSGAVLSLLRRGRTATLFRSVVIADTLGGKLLHVQGEAEEISTLLRTDILPCPTREEFLAAVAGAHIVHVATHCRFDRHVPLLSAIHLTGGPVTAADLLEARTPAALVVCSGCETGAHRVLPGDELMGFARAWFHAGAASLVLSLWPVADLSARPLMRRFYERLLTGESAPAALRQAALSLRDDGYAHPLHWAPFIFVGDPDTEPLGSRLPAGRHGEPPEGGR